MNAKRAEDVRETQSAGSTVLAVEGLNVGFPSARGPIRAVGGISYQLSPERTLAIVGESGSGKSVSARAVMGLLPDYSIVSADRLEYRGQDLTSMAPSKRQALRGSHMSMVFQDVLSSLHPLYPVGWQVAEVFRIHEPAMPKSEVWDRVVELFDRVRIPSPKRRVHDYPHQFSGGMRQRVMIAMSIALNPDLLIADEPTTALDVTVQAQIMELLARLSTEERMALVLITHDLGLVRDYADDVAVMYAGEFVETGTVKDVYQRPAHPYTLGLLRSRPSAGARIESLEPIPGSPPPPESVPEGCAFHPRCSFREARCLTEDPQLRPVGTAGREAACHFSERVLHAQN